MTLEELTDIIARMTPEQKLAVSVLMEAAYSTEAACFLPAWVEQLLPIADECDMLNKFYEGAV
jgi:hypothetical protein